MALFIIEAPGKTLTYDTRCNLHSIASTIPASGVPLLLELDCFLGRRVAEAIQMGRAIPQLEFWVLGSGLWLSGSGILVLGFGT